MTNPRTIADTLTRRQILCAAMAAGAAMTWRPSFAQDPDPYHGLKVGVHSYSVRTFSFDRAVTSTRELGLGYIGLNPLHLPLDSAPETLAAARDAIAEAGLQLMACGVVQFDGDAAKARQAFEYAHAMRMPTIVANPRPEAFDILDELVEEFDIRIAIHNHGPGSLYSLPGDVLRAIEGRDSRIGACADLGHFERSGVKAAQSLKALKDRLYDIHLKDVDKAEGSGKSVVMGQGIVDFTSVFEALLELGFDGHVALEYEAEPENPIPGMEASLRHARQVLGSLHESA